MIKTEIVIKNGVKYRMVSSTGGYLIRNEKNGLEYLVAYDPLGKNNIYVETGKKPPKFD